MKFKSIISASLMVSMLAGLSSCKDEMAEINTDPSSISKADIPYLFTRAQLDFEPSDYLVWYYSGKFTSLFSQSFVPSGGYTSNFTEMIANGGIGSQFVAVLNIARDIDNVVSQMSADEAATYQNIQAMMKPLVIMLGLFDSDMYGSRPYSEACYARYGGTLTPKFDTQDELYSAWLDELENAVSVLSSNLPNQIKLGSQDIVFGGDVKKWAKFANSLRLKIAVRLLSQNRAKALSVAEQVANSAAGIMSGASDDYVYNRGSQDYHFNNGAAMGCPSKYVIDFMLKNSDPRIRFFSTKNDFNSEVIQAFFDAEALGQSCKIPEYILANVDYSVDAEGAKTFVGWKGMGEPWVRYYGIPVEMDASSNSDYYGGDNNYFNTNLWKVTLNGAEKSYTAYSRFQEEMVRGQKDYTFPTKPGGEVKEDKDDIAWYGMAMSTAETNLYLAELQLYGANLPKSADEYYNTAVQLSPIEYDRLAGLNKIPYYDDNRISDPFDKPIKLVAGEVATMMENEDYQLSGSNAEKLEKVYLQQYIHFMLQPIDQFVQVRRSGIPKVGSSLIPWIDLLSNKDIPRRFDVGTPNPTDLMYDVLVSAYEEQGFSAGTQPAYILNSERVWSDIGAPDFGQGPNM